MKKILKRALATVLVVLMMLTSAPLQGFVGMEFNVKAGYNDYQNGYATLNGHEYKLMNIGMTWQDAQAYCESLGGHLVTITSQQEQNVVYNLLVYGTKNSYWLGAQKNNGFKWVTGESFVFKNWARNEPNNHGGRERALMVYRNRNPKAAYNAMGQWNDLNPNGTCFDEEFFGLEDFGLICEWDNNIELNEVEVYLGDFGVNCVNDGNSIHATYKGNVGNFDSSKVKFTVADSSIAEIKDIKTSDLMQDHIDIYAEVISKKAGETTVTVSYNDASATGKLTVKQPNELKFEIEEPNLKYFEADGVFFDDSNYLSKDGISLKMKYSNAFIDELNYEINDPEILKQLKYKNAKIVFEIEEGAGLSFENVDTVTKKEILLEDFDFLTEFEDSLNIFCTDSDALAMRDAVNAKIKCSVMLLENGGYVEKISEYIGFEVQSYKRHYINEHFKAMSPGGAYKSLLNNSYAAQMRGIENTKDFKFVQFLNDGFVKAVADACGTIDEQQAYQLMIADLVSTISGNMSESTGEIYGETLLKRCGDILDILVSMVEVEGLGGDLKKHILALDAKQISEFITGTGKNEIMVDIFNRLTADDFYRDKLAKALGNAEKLGKICAYGGLALGATNDVIKIIRIYSSLDTISEMLEEQKCILKDLKATAEEYGEIAIADALESYIDFSSSAITDDIIKTCVNNLADDSVDLVVMSTGKILTDMVVANINNFVAQEIFLVAGSTVSSFLAGFELGGFVSDLLCNNNDYGAACMQIVLGAHMSLIVKSAASSYLQEMLSSMNSDLDYAFKCAQKLDYSLNVFKQLEIMTCENTVAALSARATSAIFKTFCSNKFGDYRDDISYANCRKM